MLPPVALAWAGAVLNVLQSAEGPWWLADGSKVYFSRGEG